VERRRRPMTTSDRRGERGERGEGQQPRECRLAGLQACRLAGELPACQCQCQRHYHWRNAVAVEWSGSPGCSAAVAPLLSRRREAEERWKAAEWCRRLRSPAPQSRKRRKGQRQKSSQPSRCDWANDVWPLLPYACCGGGMACSRASLTRHTRKRRRDCGQRCSSTGRCSSTEWLTRRRYERGKKKQRLFRMPAVGF